MMIAMRCLSCRSSSTFCFVAAAVWLLRLQHQVASSLLRTTTTRRRQERRRQQVEQVSTFVTYTTTSNVQEEALLDQDVLTMGARLALDTNDGINHALSTYQQGRFAETSSTPATFTLQGLSTSLPTDTTAQNILLQQYRNYYGTPDYANQWILAAFQDQDAIAATNAFSNGKMDLSLLANSSEGQAVAIKTATIVMSFWMQVIQVLYQAIDSCNISDITDSLHYWDQAVAFYTGSSTEWPTSQGVLLHSLAQIHCKTFGTCDADGMAQVNTAIYTEFRKGQDNLESSQCQDAKQNVKQIVQYMLIPLIQGTLSTMHAMDANNDARETTRAQGAAFAAAILPLLDQCNPNYAALVYRDMQIGENGAQHGSFEVVKNALETQYDCLDITCDNVGGIVDLVNPGQYLEGAEPCGPLSWENDDEEGGGDDEEKDEDDKNASSSSSSSNNSNKNVEIGLAIGLVLALAVLVFLMVRYPCCCRRRRRQSTAAAAVALEDGSLSTEDPAKPAPVMT